MKKLKSLKRIIVFLLLFTVLASYTVPLSVYAEKKTETGSDAKTETETDTKTDTKTDADKKNDTETKVIRVGWFDSSFCYYDTFGRRCGIAYEYEQKISAYTGWTYEYVEDSWSNLFQMLMDGEIDLLSDVSYKPEREEKILYPDLPMGTESYYIYIDADNREISSDDINSFNGKRIGVNKGSIQEDFLKEWADNNGVSLKIVQLSGGESESMEMVDKGEIDGYASIFTYDTKFELIPVARIGGSDYFYGVNKNRPDILSELNMALA